jgi:aspartate/methionine/tyrosine aminotransferase
MSAMAGATVSPLRQKQSRLIDLSGERLGLPSSAHVREAAKRALDEGATHYTTRPGLNPLRRAIAEKLERENGVRVHPEREVLVTCGTREALFVALHVLLERGDEAVVAGPAPRLYRDLGRMAGGIVRVAVGDPEGGFAVDPERVARRLSKRSRVLVLLAPSRPAGDVPDAERLDALAELATVRGLVVLSVETLEPFVYDGATHRSIGSLPGMADRTVTVNGFSEAHGLAGWRVGYMAGPASLLGPMIQLKQALSICSPAVSQHAALAALTGPQEFMAESRALVERRRGCAFAGLDGASISYVRPTAGYTVLLDARDAPRGDGVQRALRASRLRLGSGHAVGAPGWLSMALTSSPEVLEQAVERLAVALAQAKGGRDGE